MFYTYSTSIFTSCHRVPSSALSTSVFLPSSPASPPSTSLALQSSHLASSSRPEPQLPKLSHSQQHNFPFINGVQSYSVYPTLNTPSTCPQSCRSLPVCPSDSPNSAFVVRDCTSGRALPRWATRSKSELDRLCHILRHWEGSVSGCSDEAVGGKDVRSQHLAVHCPVCGFGRHLGGVYWVTSVLVGARTRDRRSSAHLGSTGVVNEACTLAQNSFSEEVWEVWLVVVAVQPNRGVRGDDLLRDVPESFPYSEWKGVKDGRPSKTKNKLSNH